MAFDVYKLREWLDDHIDDYIDFHTDDMISYSCNTNKMANDLIEYMREQSRGGVRKTT